MKKVLIVITLLLLIAVSITGCADKGLTEEQRQTYINMAIEYEDKASAQQQRADDCWHFYHELLAINPSSETPTKYGEMCKRHDKLAEEYRQQARHYMTLAEQ